MTVSEDYRFLNPYNFVRCLSPIEREEESPQAKLLGRCTPPPHDRYIGLTGKIDCVLEAKTPIFVSDSEFIGEKCSAHKSYRFFKLRDENGQEKKAIPATSLRGMLRNVFEAATNSCFGVFEGGLLGKREVPSKYEGELYAGLIERVPAKEGTQGQVKKMKAYKVPHNKFAGYKNKVNKNGKKVFVKLAGNKVEDIKEEPTGKYQEGFMKISGPGRKRNEYVFMESDSPEEFILPFKVYQDYIIANRNNRIPHTRELKIGDT
ncbi:MAG: hypothetical protein GX996_10950, partial [Firmicutes bacterium]|nr:hypothetical protein [Bacillota bacterium]